MFANKIGMNNSIEIVFLPTNDFRQKICNPPAIDGFVGIMAAFSPIPFRCLPFPRRPFLFRLLFVVLLCPPSLGEKWFSAKNFHSKYLCYFSWMVEEAARALMFFGGRMMSSTWRGDAKDYVRKCAFREWHQPAHQH